MRLSSDRDKHPVYIVHVGDNVCGRTEANLNMADYEVDSLKVIWCDGIIDRVGIAYWDDYLDTTDLPDSDAMVEITKEEYDVSMVMDA